MERLIILVFVIFISSCASSTQLKSDMNSQEIAEVFSCEEISQRIDKLDKILKSVSPSETQRLYEETAMSAAKTGLSLSGVLGSAGPLASLGINFMEGLYKINAKKRQEVIKQAAEEEKFLMWDAYYYKECEI